MRKHVGWSGVAALLPALAGCQLFRPPAPSVLYEERVSQAENNAWWVGQQEGYRIWIGDGKYQWAVQPNTFPRVRCSAAGQFEDCVFSVDVEHQAGLPDKSEAGLLFRFSPDGTFRVRKVVGGTWTILKAWTSSPAIA